MGGANSDANGEKEIGTDPQKPQVLWMLSWLARSNVNTEAKHDYEEFSKVSQSMAEYSNRGKDGLVTLESVADYEEVFSNHLSSMFRPFTNY